MAEILALGELLMDCIVKNGQVTQANPGGAPSNYLAAASRYGASCAYIGKVGADDYGRELKDTLENCAIDCSGMVMDKDCRTTRAFVTLDEKGDRSFSFSRDADTKLTEAEIDYSLIDSCRIFHFAGSLSLTDDPCRTTLHKAAEYAREKGKLISYDPNVRELAWNGDMERARRELLWGCKIAQIIKISEDEAEFLGVTPESLLKTAFLVLLTRDSRGAVLYTRKETVDVACPSVKVVDTTGAGDIFNGAAASRLIRFMDGSESEDKANQSSADGAMTASCETLFCSLTREQLFSIASFAVTAASLSTQVHGAISSIPDMAEIQSLMRTY